MLVISADEIKNDMHETWHANYNNNNKIDIKILKVHYNRKNALKFFKSK